MANVDRTEQLPFCLFPVRTEVLNNRQTNRQKTKIVKNKIRDTFLARITL
jgi:hypothetical protein